MAKYRIIKKDGRYAIQEKFWLVGWISAKDAFDQVILYKTFDVAEKWLLEYIKMHKDDGKVIKEYG